VQNCVTIRLGDIAPLICEIAYQMYSRLAFSGSSNSLPRAAMPISTAIWRNNNENKQINKSKDVVSRNDVSFVGPENEVLHFDPIFCQKTEIFGRFSTRPIELRLKTGL